MFKNESETKYERQINLHDYEVLGTSPAGKDKLGFKIQSDKHEIEFWGETEEETIDWHSQLKQEF